MHCWDRQHSYDDHRPATNPVPPLGGLARPCHAARRRRGVDRTGRRARTPAVRDVGIGGGRRLGRRRARLPDDRVADHCPGDGSHTQQLATCEDETRGSASAPLVGASAASLLGSASRSSLPGETAAHDECCSSASQGCAPEQTIRGQRHRLAVVQVMRPARRPAFWPAAFWPALRPRRWDPTWLGDRLLVSCGREAGRRAGGHRAGPGARPATARSRCPAHARRPRACPTRGCARRPGRRRGPCR